MEIATDLPLARNNVGEPLWSVSDNLPFPWPPPEWPVPISAPSVYLKGNLVTRHLTSKEACHLLDIPGIWSSDLIQNIWSWGNGQTWPLRIYVEFLLKASFWLSGAATAKEEDFLVNDNLRNEVSTLLLHTQAASRVGTTDLFRLSHFRWLWEP